MGALGGFRVTLGQIHRFVRGVSPVGQQEVGHVHRRLELHVHAPRETPAIRATRLRRLETQETRYAGRKVALPAARDDDPAAPHQPAIAGVDGRMRIAARPEGRPRRMIEIRN